MRIFALVVLALSLVCWVPSASAGKGKGVLAGKALMPREIGAEAHKYWQNYELTKSIATSLAESAGYLGAFHDNFADDSNTVLASRDCGLYQVNIPASAVDTEREHAIRTESFDEDVWRPVFEENTRRALALYNQPWTGRTKRLWQPWVAYTTGWATFPAWWVWHQDATGNSVGPWLPTGRYIQRAIAGQMNMHVVILKDWTSEAALSYAHRYAEHFGVADTLYLNSQGIVTWRIPPKPSTPPADGVGPRPVHNDGV